MKPITLNLENVAGFYGERKNSLDMVYLGGSVSIMSWQPLRAFEKEGIVSYNYGTEAIQPEAYKTVIKEVLKRQKPQLILIDARAFQYREKEQPPSKAAYRNTLTGMPLSLNKINFIHKNVKKNLNDDPLSYYFDIIKYHKKVKTKQTTATANLIITKEVRTEDQREFPIYEKLQMAFNQYQNPNKGYYFIPKLVEKQTKPDNKNIITKTPIAKETQEILIDLLEYMKTTDCDYLFLVTPYVEKQLHKENFNYVSDIVNAYGYKFLDTNDYYDEMKIDFDTDLWNDSHTNNLGAEKYTDFLITYLKENYNLPNRKDDKNYEDWKELLPEWHKNVEEKKERINKRIEEMNSLDSDKIIKES